MIQIGRKDIFWNYGATFLKIASSILLLPFVLRTMPSEKVGIWSIFMTITAFSTLLDFGFSSSFTRNVTYVFSGVRNLKVKGFEYAVSENQIVDYGLLKGVITAMRWFYLRMSIILFFILSTLGTFYIFSLLRSYKGDHQEVYFAWVLLCFINTYNLYTQYYDSLLQGKGLVKRSKQIVIVGQTVYFLIATILIMSGFGLVAVISAQVSSVIIIRWLAYHSFFTMDLKHRLNMVLPRPPKEVLKAIYPNALKIGLTSLGAFVVQRSAIIIGSLYLPLEVIATYSITIQLISVIASLAGIYTLTYQPKMAQLRVDSNSYAIKTLYLKGQIVFLMTYILGGISLLIFGELALNFVGSQTKLLPSIIVLVALIISLLENNHGIAGAILLTNNEVPFFKASLLAGAITICILIVMFYYTNVNIWAMILAPGIAHLYNNFKWPYEVIKQLNISLKDIAKSYFNLNNSL
ncbi:MAG: O-unit flippase-like protein [Bacteroidota bacterium]